MFQPTDGMNPIIEGSLDKAYDLVITDTIEGKNTATIIPIIQIIIHGESMATGPPRSTLPNVITNAAAFPSPDNMIPDCMSAIRAAEGTVAAALGYVVVGTGMILDEEFPIQAVDPSLIGIAVDRNSWGKALVSEIIRDESGLLTVPRTAEYVGLGLFNGTIFNPWEDYGEDG